MPRRIAPLASHGHLHNTAPSQCSVRILFIEDLSLLIGKSLTTIRTFATSEKYKHLIPRPFKMPGSRRLCWYEHDVLAWIASTKPVEPPPPRRPRGRPTKAEQLARQRWASNVL
jgi:predicted DNA-binding transcriptional regulator AlpA